MAYSPDFNSAGITLKLAVLRKPSGDFAAGLARD
jgi:hypothetical protein